MKIQKILTFMLFCAATIAPQVTMAQSENGGYGEGNTPPHKSPNNTPRIELSYNEATTMLTVCFLSAVSDAEIVIVRNNETVVTDTVSAMAGQSVPYQLSSYGSGDYIVYVRKDSTLLAYDEITIE